MTQSGLVSCHKAMAQVTGQCSAELWNRMSQSSADVIGAADTAALASQQLVLCACIDVNITVFDEAVTRKTTFFCTVLQAGGSRFEGSAAGLSLSAACISCWLPASAVGCLYQRWGLPHERQTHFCDRRMSQLLAASQPPGSAARWETLETIPTPRNSTRLRKIGTEQKLDIGMVLHILAFASLHY